MTVRSHATGRPLPDRAIIERVFGREIDRLRQQQQQELNTPTADESKREACVWLTMALGEAAAVLERHLKAARKTLKGEPTCTRCGCTQDRACDGGCAWMPNLPNVCTACATPTELSALAGPLKGKPR
jgi:hypothetical protein